MKVVRLQCRLLGLMLAFGATASTMAHPGHGVTESAPHSVTHYLVEPMHAFPIMLSMGVVLVVAIWFAMHRRSR